MAVGGQVIAGSCWRALEAHLVCAARSRRMSVIYGAINVYYRTHRVLTSWRGSTLRRGRNVELSGRVYEDGSSGTRRRSGGLLLGGGGLWACG